MPESSLAEEILTAIEGDSDSPSPSLVNEKSLDQELAEAILFPEESKSQPAPAAKTPATWFGETTAAFARGVDQLQETVYGLGALTAGAAREGSEFGETRDWFIKKAKEQEDEIAKNPASVPSYEGIGGFDTGVRWVLGAAGEQASQIIESALTGLAGAFVGSSAGPAGAAGGGVAGFVGRKAARELIREGVDKMVTDKVAAKAIRSELAEYARGKIEKDALQDATKNLLNSNIGRHAAKTGTLAAIASSSIGKEVGSIYTDLLNDPNITEGDRRAAALTGGIIAGLADAVPEAFLASKFFPHGRKVARAELDAAKGYLGKYVQAFGKEILKYQSMEGGTELFQTIVEEAAKNWADPEKRDKIFTFNDQQKKGFIESTMRGVLGGTAFGTIGGVTEVIGMRPHANPKVRAKERDVIAKADEQMEVPEVEEDPVDTKLSEIGTKRSQIEAAIANPDTTPTQREAFQKNLEELDAEETALLAEDETLVNEKEFGIKEAIGGLATGAVDSLYDSLFAKLQAGDTTELGKPSRILLAAMPAYQSGEIKTVEDLKKWVAQNEKPAPKTPVQPQSPAERNISVLRAFYAQRMPSPGASQEVKRVPTIKLAEKRSEVDSLVNEITKDQTDPAAKQYGAKLSEGFTDDIVRLLAAEDVSVRTATPEDLKQLGDKQAFSALIDKEGKIAITIPDFNYFLKDAQAAEANARPGSPAQASTAFVENIPTTVLHEVAHVLDLVAMRDEWNSDKDITFSRFVGRRNTERGKAMVDAYPLLARELREAYEPGKLGRATDQQIGQEFPRMMFELARTGKLSEVTEAISRAERAAKDDSKGRISKFLNEWIQAIKQIHSRLVAMFDPETAHPEMVKAFHEMSKAFHEMSKVADRYGILVNEDSANQPSVKKDETQQTKEETGKTEVKADQPAPVVEVKPATKKGKSDPESRIELKPKNKKRIEKELKGRKLAKPLKGEAKKLSEKPSLDPALQPEAEPAKAAVPTEPAVIAEILGSSYDGEMMEQLWMFTDRQPDSPSFGTTYATEIGATFEQVKDKLLETQAKFAAAQAFTPDATPALAARPPLRSFWMDRSGEIKASSNEVGVHARLSRGIMGEGVDMGGLYHEMGRMGYSRGVLEGDTIYIEGELNPSKLKALRQLAENYALAVVHDMGATVKQLFDFIEARPALAARPVLATRDQRILDKALIEANRASNSVYASITPKEAEEKRVRGEVPLENYTPLDLFYSTRPHTQSAVDAQLLVNEKGNALVVAEALQDDPMGKKLGQMTHGPDSKLHAVYENVNRQLINLDKALKNNGATLKARSYVKGLQREMEEAMRRIGNEAGSYNAYTGKSEQLWTGESARRDYVETILTASERVLGKDAKTKLKKLAKELNEVWTRYSGVVVNQPKVISLLRKMQKMVDKGKFEKGYRQTISKSVDKLKAITKGAAARAADHLSLDPNAEARAQVAARRIIEEMSGIPKETHQRSEHDIFFMVVNRIAKAVGKEQGLILDNPKGKKPTPTEMFVDIMRNERLYATFIEQIRREFIKEYGGPSPTPEFLQEAEMLYARLANRIWEDGMVKALVNEKIRELNVKFANIVQRYPEGEAAVEKIRNEISDTMREEGIENPALIDLLVQDVNDSMREQIESAREKFFGSSKTIKDFLRQHQISLAQAVTDMAIHADNLIDKFEDILVDDYGFPNSTELPLARQMAQLMQREFNGMVEAENAKIVQRWLDDAEKSLVEKDKPSAKRKLNKAITNILKLAKAGVMRQEDVYRALQDEFGLPPYKHETADRIQALGDLIYESKSDRTKSVLTQELSDLIANTKGLSTSESYVSWMYFSMLSGISTSLVNIGGNATSLMGYFVIESIKHPTRVPRMMRAMVRAMAGSAQLEMREAFFTGYALGKTGEKYFRQGSPAELTDPVFQSPIGGKLGELDKTLAEWTHKILRGIRGKYVGRALIATDIFFYKIAQEMAYTSRFQGEGIGTPAMWDSAMTAARSEMIATGQNPDLDRASKRRHQILANEIYEGLRLRDKDGNLVNERATAWDEAHIEAMDATFQQDPTGFLGFLAKHIERFTADWPAAKMIVPFTRVAANVTNHMLEWTPFGMARYLLTSIKNKENPFKLVEDGKWKKESDIALRSIIGMATIMVLIASAAEDEGEDPDFTIYGDGPRDINQRRMLQQRGWKPNSVKIGGVYYSYLYTPLAMALSIVGRQMDDYRDGKIASPGDISLASTSVAILEAVKNQSFLATAAGLMGAIDSPDPEKRVSQVFARFGTIPIPNIIKQIDKFIDPSLQQAQGFQETWLKEWPLARHLLKPAINYFGEEIDRTPGLVRIPGFDRFATMEKTDDLALNIISERRLKPPGFSKGTHLGDVNMTPEQYYEYVKLAGPQIRKRIEAESTSIRAMSRENAQERLEKIASEEKAKARTQLKAKYLSR